MKIVNSYNEWDPLEEVILGIPDGACIPQDEPAYRLTTPMEYSTRCWPKPGKRSDESIKKASFQYDNLARVLEFQWNIKIHRPEKMNFSESTKTPYFESDYQIGATCPRDTLLVIGNELIEATMSCRARYFETMAYRSILNEIWSSDPDFLWTMAPKPTMSDKIYRLDYPRDKESNEHKQYLKNHIYLTTETEPLFDAADVLRLGQDLIVQHCFTTNRKGIEWLRRHTKSRGYRVHEVHFPDDPEPVHIDASLVPIFPPTKERKGVLLSSPDRPIDQNDYDRIFIGSNWKVEYAPEPNSRTVPDLCQSSCWLSINTLMLRPDVCVVEETEKPLIKYLESRGIKCVIVPFRDAYEFGGSIHCATSDIRRRGNRLNYFPNFSNGNDLSYKT